VPKAEYRHTHGVRRVATCAGGAVNAAARDESLGSVLAALAANALVALAKGIAAALTGSPASFS
jgi:hypothetical protein